MSFIDWLKSPPATPAKEPEQPLLDQAIIEHEKRHAELRQVVLRVLYLQAKLEDEARGYRGMLALSSGDRRHQLQERAWEAERQLAQVRERAHSALHMLMQSHDDIASLRRERLKSRALRRVLQLSSREDTERQLALVEAQRELEAALS